MSLIDTLRNLGRDILNVALNRDDVIQAVRNVKIDTDSSLRPTVEEVIGTGNLMINNDIARREGMDAYGVLNSGIIGVTDELGHPGAAGVYVPSNGKIGLAKRYFLNPLGALGIYMHEAGHKVLDRVFGYEGKLERLVQHRWERNPIYGLYTAIFGHYLNEGLTDLRFRLGLVGENGFVSAYQRDGFVDAAGYALKRSGGKIRNLVNRLSRAVDDFVEALYNPRLAPAYAK